MAGNNTNSILGAMRHAKMPARSKRTRPPALSKFAEAWRVPARVARGGLVDVGEIVENDASHSGIVAEVLK